eukprot:SAG31_NODE_990_length_10529_cov_37.528340_1_plen_173_part_00
MTRPAARLPPQAPKPNQPRRRVGTTPRVDRVGRRAPSGDIIRDVVDSITIRARMNMSRHHTRSTLVVPTVDVLGPQVGSIHDRVVRPTFGLEPRHASSTTRVRLEIRWDTHGQHDFSHASSQTISCKTEIASSRSRILSAPSRRLEHASQVSRATSVGREARSRTREPASIH